MSNALPQAARELAGRLATAAPLWRPPAFRDDPPWVIDRPRLADALLATDDGELEVLENDPARLLAFVSAHAPGPALLDAAARDCIDDEAPPDPLPVAEIHGRDVPGRKWRQALHFAAACGTPHGPLVDWCCGKAHLGRLLAHARGIRVTGIERNATLCAAGNALAARDGLDVRIVQADALRVSAADAGLGPRAHAVALHACGDLHLALLRAAAGARTAAVDVAPCCYHLTGAQHWHALSGALGGSPLDTLALTRNDLRLAVQETVTASRRVATQTRRLVGWRLGFDRLQRELSGTDAALPTPSRPLRVLDSGFAAFCADMAAHHGLHLPAGTDFAHWEREGAAREARMRRLQLPRHACRRPLEVLLAADRALWLAEQGYEVRLRTFCPRMLTPRNLLIQARWPAAATSPLMDAGSAPNP